MDRFVLVVNFTKKGDCKTVDKDLDLVKQIHDFLKSLASTSAPQHSLFPACLPGRVPAGRRWYFAVQASCGSSQFCSSEWDELGVGCHRSDCEDTGPSALDTCRGALLEKGAEDDNEELLGPQAQSELFEEAAEVLHQLADKLPPPGQALLDVVLLSTDTEAPSTKEFLPVLGSLKHMQAWHSAKITVATANNAGWQTIASYLLTDIHDQEKLLSCIDQDESWRGSILVREKKFLSELRFGGFCLKARPSDSNVLSARVLSQACTDRTLNTEVFQYYQPVLDLVQLVSVPDLPVYLHSRVEFDLALTTKTARSRLLLDQLSTLRGKVGALFSLSCTVSSLAVTPAPQLGSQKWKEFIARRPKALPVPDVEVKGELGQYFWLVQGTDTGGCTARMIHSANQINGAAALATANGLLGEKDLALSGTCVDAWLSSLPCLHGDQLIRRERNLEKVQALAVKECLRRREESLNPVSIPVTDLKVLLRLAREQYLMMHDARLPRAATLIAEKENHTREVPVSVRTAGLQDLPERSVLLNFENQAKIRQQRSSSLRLASGSSECLLGPKDGQKETPALLDAKEMLRHFSSDGHPTGELQPLPVQRGEHPFQLSSDLTPRKVTQLPFSKATRSHYHGIEFCLDEQKALDRDKSLVRLHSRLIRYETQTTCSKEPRPVPFALSPAPFIQSPAPSPSVLSEPSSIPDGEALMSETRGEPPRLKRRCWEADGMHTYKRLVKSDSNESLGSKSSGSSGTQLGARTLRRKPAGSQVIPTSARPAPCPQRSETTNQPPAGDAATKESRSQKHNRVGSCCYSYSPLPAGSLVTFCIFCLTVKIRSVFKCQMLNEVVMKTLKLHGITGEHKCFEACSQRLFEISKFYLKDLKTSRGLHEEMKKAAQNNCKQVIQWVLEKASRK
ncbi:mdm2-binding protein isoform X2 [Brienomyrus brachyistius]|uniref:mdm2-binding protein isoform X2 n=1 Tax=Brienomyrus brachyistius TaxID=42636 RepID=UPI0020B1FAB5|nr:mdm2-binding protein isoform X2 [Brienomyrus brachyistius]